MDLFAGLFGLILFTVGVGVTYQWGIKPEREAKKRRAVEALAVLRRRHLEQSGNRRRMTDRSPVRQSDG
ncbi:MAG TPA: hypothetical protein VK208_12035 [Pyrinomonadaceae bacterium]|jgi:hypothetical protein|nr:hypothetical protein [Pyrinomonadaceae bacterium]